MDGLEALLSRELDTLWRVDERGRLAGVRFSDPGVVPWVAVASVAGRAVVWACSTELGADAVLAVNALLSGGAQASALVDVVPKGRVEEGASWVGPPSVARGAGGVECWTGHAGGDRERLVGMLPEEDRRALVEPWAVAVVDGQVGSVCETARDSPSASAAEAGVWTYEPFRRRGLAVAAVSAWMALQADRGRTPFYSTSSDNVASAAVAARLGLRPLASWWSVRVPGPR